jgi:hypothetical protein
MSIEYDRKFIKDFQMVPQHVKIAFAEIHSSLETILTVREINRCRKLEEDLFLYNAHVKDNPEC